MMPIFAQDDTSKLMQLIFYTLLNCLFLNYMLAERCQCQGCKLEMLSAKWNTDDGDAKDNAKHQMSKTNPNPTKENPKDIHDDA